MSKQSTSTVYGMPFGKNPRDGQRKVFETAEDIACRSINVQLPTGYGKSFVNAGVYSILKKQNRVNRLLVIVPTSAQNEQYIKDGPADLKDACAEGNLAIHDVKFGGIQAIKHHRNGTRQVFVITVQSLLHSANDVVKTMMQSGNWMVTVDEYHHYGVEKSWGKVVTNLPYAFLLAMSATPYRATDDSAFGAPNVVVSYREAVKAGCVKELCGHSYLYKIDALLPDKSIITMTTDDLISDVGSCSPDAIERHAIERSMRWSPKYVSPLVSHPIERMHGERIKSGEKLQVIIGAMCVSHATLVCEQVKSMYPELSVDWVGTGENGRKPEENQAVLERFCPKKDEHGRRIPTLDILVHVGMAGEGLDSIHVSEIIHLNKASINNSNNQENGRAARFLKGQGGKPIIGNINFDSSSEYATKGYIGNAIMDAMDNLPASVNENDPEGEDHDYEPLPDKPAIQIWNMELEHIDSGSPEVTRMAKILANDIAPKRYGVSDLESDIGDPDSKLHAYAMAMFKTMRENECAEFNEKSVIQQWKDQVNSAVSKVTGLVIKVVRGENRRFEKTFVGDIKRQINTRKRMAVGKVENDIDVMKKHFQWLKNLESEIIETKEVPTWLL